LDARDPEGSRSDQIDELAVEKGKKLIYIINKIDLVPESNLKEWLKYYKA
jgi:nuclear GTP-binding protein